MSRILVPLLLLAACKAKPSEEELTRRYNAAVKQAIADAAPTYQLFTTMRGALSTETPTCSGPPPPGVLRISWGKLKALTGDPVDRFGTLIADEPSPNDPDARRLSDPNDGGGDWNSNEIDGLPSPGQVATGATESMEIEIKKTTAARSAAVQAAAGYLVQTIDAYKAPQLVESSPGKSGFVAGQIDGRIVMFAKDGKPGCHYSYSATNKSSVESWVNYNGGLKAGIVRDIKVEMTRSIIAALAGK
ncbi:MAG: hypothetical protein JWO36_3349 [Myxococcales bacterium]|nr:hypothetical protein [Myxococcales bacterium]